MWKCGELNKVIFSVIFNVSPSAGGLKKKMPAHTTYSMMYMYVHIFTEYKYVQVCIMAVLP